MSAYSETVEKQIEKIENGIVKSIKLGELSYFYNGIASEETEEYFKNRGLIVKRAYNNTFADFIITKETNLNKEDDKKETKTEDKLEKEIEDIKNKLEKNKKDKKSTMIDAFVLCIFFFLLSIPPLFISLYTIPIGVVFLTTLVVILYYVYYAKYRFCLENIAKNELKLNELLVQQYDKIIEEYNKNIRIKIDDEPMLEELENCYETEMVVAK